ncbi:polyneuridine-aldehyde esterase-like protein [Corchorus olitorius]|uniref:Polyneuridine-aldehyde esterase-like protein n=1 Tax=Corchorus olitorius TaxID=93759 RepID=A0A1R3K4V2_9ROSI|nr:polyneuridine-aldehyde esterase-like protein [Corchorus olitorius]
MGSPSEPLTDLELAKTLVRPGSLFQQDLSKAKNFSEEGYGSVTRVFVVCDQDKAIPLDFQRWMIQNNPPKDVIEIKGADHMAILSKTKQVSDSILEIANKYA